MIDHRAVTLVLLSLIAVPAGTAQSVFAGAGSAPPPSRGHVISNSIGMQIARIPAGSFQMGSPPSEAERDSKEIPHQITITRPFYMGVHEVTQAQFAKVADDVPDFRGSTIFDSNRGGGPEHPMENIEWVKAKAFCAHLSQRADEQQAGRSYRLPTEAEWEYACRAGTSTAFHFGPALSSRQANFNGNYPAGDAEQGPYRRKTVEVGSYPPNAFGLCDMHGNVAEWCSDFYDPKYYLDSPPEDPLGPPFGVVPTGFEEFYRVVRGGCWVDEGRACRSAYRFRAMPATQYRLIGFRVVCEIEP